MSGPRRSSRHKKKDVQLVVSCMGPNPDAKVDHKTSFYEIDIQSNFDCPEYRAGRRKRKAPAGAAVKVASKDLRARTREKGEEDEENPFVGERYPKLNDITYEEHRSSPSQNAGFKAETQLIADAEKEKERKNLLVNKKRLWTSGESPRKFDKHVKSYIIEHFVGEKRSELETMVQNYEEDLDANEVHLHHHEHHHHHHYYANGKAVGGENGAPPLFFEDNFNPAPDVFYATMTAPNKEGKASEAEQPCSLLDGRPPHGAEEPFAVPKVSGGSSERLATGARIKERLHDLSSRSPVNKTSSKNVQSGLTSTGTVTGADFLFFNAGEEPVLADNLEIHGLRVEKNKSPKTCNSLMESFKNISHIMSPIVLTDHKTVPKFWYIRCKCCPWSNEGTSSEECREVTNEPGTMTDGMGVTKAARTGENSIGLPMEAEKNQIDFTKELEFEVWLSKLRDELCEIKHQLKRIEAKRLLGNGSATLSFRNEKPITDSNQITVYSSRTFIVQPSEDAMTDV